MTEEVELDESEEIRAGDVFRVKNKPHLYGGTYVASRVDKDRVYAKHPSGAEVFYDRKDVHRPSKNEEADAKHN